MVVIAVFVLSIQGLLVRLISVDRWTMICWSGFFSFVSLSIGFIFFWRGQTLSRFVETGLSGIFAAVILSIANILFIAAFTLTSIANTLIFSDSVPLMAALLSWLVLREKVPVWTWLSILAGLWGIVVIFHGSLTGGRWVGDLCALGTAVSLAVYLIFVQHVGKRNMLPALSLSGLFIALFVLPWAKPFSVGGTDLGLFFLLGGIAFPVGLGLITCAPRYIPATEVGLILLLDAVLGATWAWLLLAEKPGLQSLLGGIIIIGALVFNSLVGWKNAVP